MRRRSFVRPAPVSAPTVREPCTTRRVYARVHGCRTALSVRRVLVQKGSQPGGFQFAELAFENWASAGAS